MKWDLRELRGENPGWLVECGMVLAWEEGKGLKIDDRRLKIFDFWGRGNRLKAELRTWG